jgi:hypothetical protein|tara:strand:+ start:512 stop:712 length:201 start_codon:yes stop_codon:yes gene_type:complete
MQIESMPASLLFALLCSHAALYLFGMFCGMMITSRNKLTQNQREYRRAHEKEMRQKMNDHWNHPSF